MSRFLAFGGRIRAVRVSDGALCEISFEAPVDRDPDPRPAARFYLRR